MSASSIGQGNDMLLDKKVAGKAYLHILLPLFVASMLAFLDRVNVSFADLEMAKDLNFTPEIYGFGAGIFFAGYFFFEIPGSVLAEKWSPSKWIARIMFTWGAVCVLLAFVTLPWHFYLLRFLLGACEASLYPVIYACVIPRWFTERNRARAISLTLTSLLFSAIIGGPLAGWVLEFKPLAHGAFLFFDEGVFKGWQFLFAGEGIITCFYGLFILKFLHDDPAKAKWLNDEEKNYLVNTLAEEHARKTSKAHYSLMQALTNPRVLRLCVTYLAWLVGFWGFNFFLPQIIKAAAQAASASGTILTPFQIGLLSAIPMATALIAMILIGNSASSKNESRKHVGFTLFFGCVGYLMLALTWGNIVLSIISVSVIAVGVYAAMGTWWSIPTTFLTGTAAAGAVGMINSVGNISGFIGPYVIGVVKTRYDTFTPAFYIFAACLLISSMLVLTLKNKK